MYTTLDWRMKILLTLQKGGFYVNAQELHESADLDWRMHTTLLTVIPKLRDASRIKDFQTHKSDQQFIQGSLHDSDQVNWNYQRWLFEQMGFEVQWWDWIEICIVSCASSVLTEDEADGLSSTRGQRQGDSW